MINLFLNLKKVVNQKTLYIDILYVEEYMDNRPYIFSVPQK